MALVDYAPRWMRALALLMATLTKDGEFIWLLPVPPAIIVFLPPSVDVVESA